MKPPQWGEALGSLERVRTSLDQNHDTFFAIVHDLEQHLGQSVFDLIISSRQAQLAERDDAPSENLADLLASADYAQAAQHPLQNLSSPLSETEPQVQECLHAVECIASQVARNIGATWTLYELGRNTAAAELATAAPQTPATAEPPGDIVSELVPDIATDTRPFRTPGLPIPARLPHVVTDQFLELVQEQTWWEALQTLNLSARGRHAIVSRPGSDQDEIPEVLATSLLQEVSAPNRENLLTWAPFFRTPHWQPEVGRRAVVAALHRYWEHNPQLPPVEVATAAVPRRPASLAALEEGLVEAFGSGHLAEWIRFTAVGATDVERLRTLYDAMGRIAQLQVDNRILFAFGVTDRALMMDIFDLLEGLTGRQCAVVTSEHMTSQRSDVPTCKLLLLNANIAAAVAEVVPRTILRGLALLKRRSLAETITVLRPT